MKFYHVDSFSGELFKGNPAGVCILGEKWISDKLMLDIAMENNMSETAFVVKESDKYHIRWFTPNCEVVLCGHATLAAAHVLFNHLAVQSDAIDFNSCKGNLRVLREKRIENGQSIEFLVLNFPIEPITEIQLNDALDCFNKKPVKCFKTTFDYLFVYSNEHDIENILPNLEKLRKLDLDGIIVTSSSEKFDFVSRYFAPKIAIDEDPVTGSAHTILVSYWREILLKNEFSAAQISKRFGALSLKISGDRVLIAGRATTYLVGDICLPDEI